MLFTTNNIETSRFTGFHYNFANGPWLANAEAMPDSINCQLFVHLAYKEFFGMTLPKGMWSKEICEDETLIFKSILRGSVLEKGDILIFGKENEKDFRKLHLTLYVGEKGHDNEPLLMHANKIDKKVTSWSISKFYKYPEYGHLHAVKRPILFMK